MNTGIRDCIHNYQSDSQANYLLTYLDPLMSRKLYGIFNFSLIPYSAKLIVFVHG